MADEFLRTPLTVRIGSPESCGVAGNKDVDQRVLILEVDEKGEACRYRKKEELWRILSDHISEKCLVFCTMKKTAAVITHQLKEDGFRAKGLHGDMAQPDRDAAMSAFKAGELKLLVATDVAARGLDVQDISAVVNYDPAETLDNHIHRIGRTSRAGKRGFAYTLLGSEDVRQAKLVAESMRNAGHDVPADLATQAQRRVENAQSRKASNKRTKKKAMKNG